MSILKKWQCHMSLSLIFPNVTCRIEEMNMSHITTFLAPMSHVINPMSNFRNAHVTLSILGVKGHTFVYGVFEDGPKLGLLRQG